MKPEKLGHVLVISENNLHPRFTLTLWCDDIYGGADGTRTHDLCFANRTTGKTLSICLSKSCSHQEISIVFPFFPIPYHRVYVTSCFFWQRIGHLENNIQSLASIGSVQPRVFGQLQPLHSYINYQKNLSKPQMSRPVSLPSANGLKGILWP